MTLLFFSFVPPSVSSAQLGTYFFRSSIYRSQEKATAWRPHVLDSGTTLVIPLLPLSSTSCGFLPCIPCTKYSLVVLWRLRSTDQPTNPAQPRQFRSDLVVVYLVDIVLLFRLSFFPPFSLLSTSFSFLVFSLRPRALRRKGALRRSHPVSKPNSP